MAEIEINIKPELLYHAFSYKIQGKTKVEDCICIPKSTLSKDKKGDYWLNLKGRDSQYEEKTHSVSQKLSKAQYESLPVDENGKKIYPPFIGNVKNAQAPNAPAAPAPVSNASVDGDDLPFS